MLAAAVAVSEEKQAEELRILELDPADSGLTDYFLLMTGSNSRQIQTLADEIELRLKREFNEMPHSREGYKQAEWVLLDYVDFVVHIFSREKREFYGLERLRKSASGVTPEQLQTALASRTQKTRSAAEEETPSRKTRRKVAETPVRAALARTAPARSAAKKTSAKAPAKKAAAKSTGKPAARKTSTRNTAAGTAANKRASSARSGSKAAKAKTSE